MINLKNKQEELVAEFRIELNKMKAEILAALDK